MRIALINYSFWPSANIELATLVAALRSEGYEVALVDFTFLSAAKAHAHALSEIRTMSPDVIGLFAGFRSENAPRLISEVRVAAGDIPFLVGGRSYQFYPFCVPVSRRLRILGAGVYPLRGETTVEFLRSLEHIQKGKEPGGRPIPPEDFNTLPVPDYRLFDMPKYFKGVETLEGHLPICSSRGCPYRCSFCNLPSWPYQPRQPGLILDEVLLQEERHRKDGMKSIGFYDPVFGARQKGLEELMRLFRLEGIGERLPWYCQTRPELITREWAEQAAKGGCFLVELSLENAIERHRRGVLGKNFTNKQFLQATKNLRGAGLKFDINIMVNVPGTGVLGDIYSFFFALYSRSAGLTRSQFCPQPGTPLGDQALAEGFKCAAHDPLFRQLPEGWEMPLTEHRFLCQHNLNRPNLLMNANHLLLTVGLVSHYLRVGLAEHGPLYLRKMLSYALNRRGERVLPFNHPLNHAILFKRILHDLHRDKLLRNAVIAESRGPSGRSGG